MTEKNILAAECRSIIRVIWYAFILCINTVVASSTDESIP